MSTVLAVAVGGALGSVARYFVGVLAARWLGFDFPWGTLAVNIIGCTLMGVLVESMALYWSPTQATRALLAIGVLGGFTTFSSFALDVGVLAGRDAMVAAVAYAVGSVALSLLGFYAGLKTIRVLLT